jgi:hypothetical protein
MAGSKLAGIVVTASKIHLIWRLAGEGRTRNHGVVLLDIEGDELLQGREAVELVQVEPAVFQGPPPRLDHRIREAHLDLGVHPAKRTDLEQGVDFLVHVLDAGVGNDGGCVAAGRQMLAGLGGRPSEVPGRMGRPPYLPKALVGVVVGMRAAAAERASAGSDVGGRGGGVCVRVLMLLSEELANPTPL